MSNIILTPFKLKLLIHLHCNPTKPIDSPALGEAIKQFLDSGIAVENPDSERGYDLTERGFSWLQDILSVPIPN
ncbi:MAG: hypothetical protein Tp138OMZ00d2C19078241_66 [Prokaryotic dsDNA virus sp.]|jgi:predicted transcriptional regulator|nr:MAG: hypothetical protein Tp138OMZ00d2C19078241_66 [Prokaryotic dsDNA virus sp.]|tara:strand:+ start:14981 stop:15202 length:222 start_codon:yes stop_codon:yes gene_type:complete